MRAGLRPNEVGERYADCVGDEKQVIEQRRSVALLQPVHGLPVEPAAARHFLLGEASSSASGADTVPDGPAAGRYPFG